MAKHALLVSFILLWFADCIATLAFISQHGIAMEANPLMRAVIEHAGLWGFIIVKIIVLLPLFKLHKHIPVWIYVGLNAIMIPVVYAGIHMAINF